MDAGGPMLAPLEDDPDGLMLGPLPGSPVLARIPAGRCAAALPGPPRWQLVDLVWDDVLTTTRWAASATPVSL